MLFFQVQDINLTLLILLAWGLARITEQSRGRVGGLVDRMGTWIEQGKLDGKMIEQLERYIIEGKYSPSLFLRFMSDPTVLKYLVTAAKTIPAVKLKAESAFVSTYPFPPLDA